MVASAYADSDIAPAKSRQELRAEISPSVLKILGGALEAIASRGVRRLSMSDIIEASGVSRGTLYRYFSSKDEILAAVSEHICTEFEDGVRKAGEGIDDPVDRFRAVMLFYSRYTQDNTLDRMFQAEPAFHLDFFRSRFGRYKLAICDALEPVFKELDRFTGVKVDRDGIAEMLVRMQLSALLVPPGLEWISFWEGSADSLHALAKRLVRS